MAIDLVDFGDLGLPDSHCPRCRAISTLLPNNFQPFESWKENEFWIRGNRSSSIKENLWEMSEDGHLVCSVCKSEYNDFSSLDLRDDKESSFEYPISINEYNINSLSALACQFPPYSEISSLEHNAWELLLKIIQQARKFVHFSTWYTTQEFYDEITGFSDSVAIRGIVGDSKSNQLARYVVTDLEENSKRGHPKNADIIFQTGKHHGFRSHIKLIIIDGIIAIRGSANLAKYAWDNLLPRNEDGILIPGEMIDVIATPQEVMRLNNTYFAPYFSMYRK